MYNISVLNKNIFTPHRNISVYHIHTSKLHSDNIWSIITMSGYSLYDPSLISNTIHMDILIKRAASSPLWPIAIARSVDTVIYTWGVCDPYCVSCQCMYYAQQGGVKQRDVTKREYLGKLRSWCWSLPAASTPYNGIDVYSRQCGI